ncbi:MAG: glycosyltransferase family 39 protein [Planctomycetota bacterium]
MSHPSLEPPRFPALLPRRFLPLLCALPTLLAAALGLGRWVPGCVELLAAAGLCGLLVLAHRALREHGRVPAWPALLALLAVTLGTVAALAGGLAGFGTPEPAPLAHLLVTRTRVAAGGSALVFGVLAVWPQVSWLWGWWSDVPPPPGQLPLARGWTRLSLVVLLAGALTHGAALCLHDGALIQIDSSVNVWEPPLFQFSTQPHHHTPLYAELVKFADRTAHPAQALWWIVVFQHLAVVVTAMVVERTTRLTSNSAVAGAFAGLLTGLCGHLSLYAQMIMSEAFSIGFLILATACVFEAPRRRRAGRWLLAAGLFAAAATLTRQVMQAWFVAGALAILFLRFPHRWRALALYLAGALIPVLALIVHNGIFNQRYSLTAGLGRTLHYRVAKGLPDLTDADAPPGDPYERARELIWERREAGWVDSYSAIQRELGWDDVQIERAMKRFYVEQVLKHPLPFARVTLDYGHQLLVGRETGAGAMGFHNLSLDNLTMWQDVPRAEPESFAGQWLHSFQPTSSWVVLLLAAFSPFLVQGRARVLALTALISTAYFLVLTALLEVPITRYRLPTVPFFAMASGLSVGWLEALIARRRGRG